MSRFSNDTWKCFQCGAENSLQVDPCRRCGWSHLPSARPPSILDETRKHSGTGYEASDTDDQVDPAPEEAPSPAPGPEPKQEVRTCQYHGAYLYPRWTRCEVCANLSATPSEKAPKPAPMEVQPRDPMDDNESLDPRYGTPHALHIMKPTSLDIDGQSYRVESAVWEKVGQQHHSLMENHRIIRAIRASLRALCEGLQIENVEAAVLSTPENLKWLGQQIRERAEAGAPAPAPSLEKLVDAIAGAAPPSPEPKCSTCNNRKEPQPPGHK